MEKKRTGSVGIRMFAFGTILAAMLLIAAAPGAMAAGEEDAQGIVDKARVAFGEFMRDDNYSWMRDHLKDAKGVLIYPQVLKAGFIFGGSGGTGVLLSRDGKTGEWGNPAFYTIGSVSFGLQIGGESAEVVLLVMSQKGMDSLLASDSAGWRRLGRPRAGGRRSEVGYHRGFPFVFQVARALRRD